MRVNIVGKGRSWEDAPALGETWGITQLHRRRPVSRIIDMNDYSIDKGIPGVSECLKELALAKRIPYVDLDNYPLEDVIRFCGTDYFSNTVDYAIALAIYEGYTEIHLYGVNMELGGEYFFERPGVDFWCGYALGKGIKVVVHGQYSTIMRTKDGCLYGYGKPQDLDGRFLCGNVIAAEMKMQMKMQDVNAV
jgi:hypothetical protein